MAFCSRIKTPQTILGILDGGNAGPLSLYPSNLVDFGGKGKYKVPEFIWFQTVAPTALKFLNSTKLGKQYQNDLFVGDYNNGNLYHFKLSQNRYADSIYKIITSSSSTTTPS
jgi:hypothetical protein